ncbi:unnamed protein product [Rodentolepis nana]|uniref:TLC domain-containing protein n=1 Tax=Rodentolepis nana TaxID=102285 RepID=A0A0R3TBT9_RODNA|nr:unnamed protein product [Rodentolepis nana]
MVALGRPISATMIYLPTGTRVISSIVFVAPGEIGFYPALYGFLAFLCGLQVLHLFWTIQIIQTALKSLTSGQISSDARSDSEMSESESEYSNGLQKNGNAKKF